MPMPGPDNVVGDYRYGYQGEFAEKDPETGKEAFELRLWDSRIGRWLTTDPAGKGNSPYIGMANNPLKYIDVKGADTLNIYRSNVVRTYKWGESEYSIDQYKLTFEIIKDGKRLKQNLVLYMSAKHQFEKVADNGLNKQQVYIARFRQMGSYSNDPDFKNTIQIVNWINDPNGSPIFLHPGDPGYNTGCKAVCRDGNYTFGPGNWNTDIEMTKQALQDIRDLYNTTDKQGMFFITGWRMFNTILNISPRETTPMPMPEPDVIIINPRYF